jgi:hypothetical protein
MANLAATIQRVRAITGDNVVPAYVLIEKRRQRAERRKRAAATIVGQAALAG